MALALYKNSTKLSREGATVIVTALHQCRSNGERFAMMVNYTHPEFAKVFLQKYDFTG